MSKEPKDVKELENKITALTQEKLELRKNLEASQQDNDRLQTQISAGETAAQKVLKDLEASKQENDKLQTRITAFEAATKNSMSEENVKAGTVKIASRSSDGFRRLGYRFGPRGTVFSVKDFSEKDLKTLEEDEQLLVLRG